MSVGSCCRRPACTARPEDTIRNAAQRMDLERVGSLVVVDGDRPVGVVTDRDIAIRVLAEGLDSTVTTVAEIAAGPPVTVAEDDSLQEASLRMHSHGLRRVPVVDPAGCVVGMLSGDDLVGLVAAELSALADVAAEQVPTRPRQLAAGVAGSRDVEAYVKDVTTVGLETTADEIARCMRADGVGCVIVLDEAASPRGIVTDRDLALRVVAAGSDPGSVAASAVMSQLVASVEPGERLQSVARAMSDNGIRRIPVVQDGSLVGIVTYDDLLMALGRELHDVGGAARSSRIRESLATRTAQARHDVEQVIGDLEERLDRLAGESLDAVGRQLDALRERLRGTLD